MNKKIKGFTLIELLAVVIILALIVVIVAPKVVELVNDSKNKAYNNQIEKIEDVAKLYITEHPYDVDFSIGNVYVTLNDLVTNGYLEAPIKNSKTGESFDLNQTVVKVSKTNEKYSFETFVNGGASKIYGVTFNPPTGVIGTRLDDAFGLVTTATATTIASDFDNEEIYSEIIEVEDTYGNQFIKIPKFWIKKTKEGTTWTYRISKTKQDEDYYLPYCFYQNGKILPYVLVGKYDASLNGDKLESKTGTTPLVNETISQFRTYARANNINGLSGYGIIDIHIIDVIQTLFYIEFATLDSQSIMAGYTNSSNTAALISGTTNSITTTGSVTSNDDGYHAMKYRGIENLWGNILQFVDGINIQNNLAYISNDFDSYGSDIFNGNYKALSYKNVKFNGSVTEMGYDENNPYAQFPIKIGTNNYKDYYYQVTGNAIARFGGSWRSSFYAGLSHWDFTYSSNLTSSYGGSRLVKYAL